MDEEILNKAREWAKDKYPTLLSNEELIVSLYKRQVLGQSIMNNQFVSRLMYIPEIENSGKIKGVVVEIGKSGTYEACPVCRRKIGMCEHGEEPIIINWARILVGDKKGSIVVSIFTEDEVKEGDIYILNVRKRDDGSYTAKILEKLDFRENTAIDIIYELIRDVYKNKIKRNVFESIVSEHGVEKERIIKIIGLREVGEFYEW